jgi:hypothetical protein
VKVTATQLVTYWTCPFLWHASSQAGASLPAPGARRRFGTLVHAAIAEYERGRGALDRALEFLEERRAALSPREYAEARAVLLWRDEAARGRAGRPVLVEGELRAFLDGHRLTVRVDRLDREGDDLLLAEVKGGRSVDLRLVRVQLAVLAFAVLDVFGRAPRRWNVELLLARGVVEVPAETDPTELRRLPTRLLQGMLGGDREPRPYDPGFCARCPARSFCPRGSASPEPLPPRGAGEPAPQLPLFPS